MTTLRIVEVHSLGESPLSGEGALPSESQEVENKPHFLSVSALFCVFLPVGFPPVLPKN